jgi:hypothetical protein
MKCSVPISFEDNTLQNMQVVKLKLFRQYLLRDLELDSALIGT